MYNLPQGRRQQAWSIFQRGWRCPIRLSHSEMLNYYNGEVVYNQEGMQNVNSRNMKRLLTLVDR